MVKVPIPATAAKITSDEGKKMGDDSFPNYIKIISKCSCTTTSNAFTRGDVGFVMSVLPTIENDWISASVFKCHG